MSDIEKSVQQNEDSGAVYVCEQHPGFFFRLNGKRFNFEKHQLKVDNKEDVDAIDELLKTNPVFGMKIKKVDVSAAEALVEKHKREHGGAVSGPFSSDLMAKMEAQRLADRDNQFANMKEGQADAIKQALDEESGLKITHKANSSEQVESQSAENQETSGAGETKKPASSLNFKN